MRVGVRVGDGDRVGSGRDGVGRGVGSVGVRVGVGTSALRVGDGVAGRDLDDVGVGRWVGSGSPPGVQDTSRTMDTAASIADAMLIADLATSLLRSGPGLRRDPRQFLE